MMRTNKDGVHMGDVVVGINDVGDYFMLIF